MREGGKGAGDKVEFDDQAAQGGAVAVLDHLPGGKLGQSQIGLP
jgi:hypothetical protein